MIAYFDTSAVIPLIVDEATSDEARSVWLESERVVSARIVYAEGHAALAQAARSGRIDGDELAGAVASLIQLYEQLDLLEISDAIVRRAGALAEHHALRGYDAIHLAAAELVQVDGLVFVAGDRDLCDAAETIGLEVVRPGGER